VLKKYGLDRKTFPILDAHFEGIANNPAREAFVNRALADTDRRVNEGKPVAPSFLMACVFWHEVSARWQALRDQGEPLMSALQSAVDATFDARIGDISGRGKLAADMREIWMMQPRFEKRTGNTPFSLVEQPRFRAGFDFLRLRGDAGEIDAELANWWEDFSLADDDGRRKLLDAARPSGGAVRRVRSSTSAPKAAGSETEASSTDTRGDDENDADEPAESAREGDPVRKRRRRRRKPAAAAGGGDSSGSESAGEVSPVPNPGHDV
jgi:poly(A) polymerase